MRRRSHYLVSVAMLAGLQGLRAQGSFSDSVRPVLEKHCFACHNGKLMTSGLSLDAFRDEAQAKASPEVWRRVLDKVSTGAMPPPAFPPLTANERQALILWIETSLGKTPLPAP